MNPISVAHLSAAERVHRGAALLDSAQPGWRAKVDRDRLDQRSVTSCVLGQVFADNSGYYSGYSAGMEALFGNGWTGVDSSGHGFAADVDREYNDLNREWRRVLDQEPLAPWERELLFGNTHTQTDVDDAREAGVKQGRADGFIAYRHALGVATDAAQAAGITLTVEQAMSMADNLLDAGILS